MATLDYIAVGDQLNRSIEFDFEKQFHEPTFKKWMLQNWTLSFIYSAAYVLVIFGGRRWMEGRPKYDLRPLLATWSGFLALFSIFGTLRTLPRLIHDLSTHGFLYSACMYPYDDQVNCFWAYLFTISKVLELGDTVFIVLRKQQLIFLHWYHHITVLVYVWYSYTEHTAPGRWFMVMNYTVHAFMYTYYAFRALGYRSPKWVMMIITTLQLAQMVIGVTLNTYIYYWKGKGGNCGQSWNNIYYSFVMYLSYFVLFADFFISTYFRKHQEETAICSKGETDEERAVKTLLVPRQRIWQRKS